MNVDEIIEYLRTLPKGTVVRVLVMDKASGHLWSSIVENVVDGDVWCREDVGTLIEDKGKKPRPRTSTGCWLPCRAGLAPSATGSRRRAGTSCVTSTTMPSTPSVRRIVHNQDGRPARRPASPSACPLRLGEGGRRRTAVSFSLKTIPKTPKNNLQSISGRSGPEGHGYRRRRGRPKISSPPTSEDIFDLSSHLCVRMH